MPPASPNADIPPGSEDSGARAAHAFRWAGYAVGVLTLLFFMGVAWRSLTEPLPCSSRIPIVIVMALGLALASGFIGGSATVTGGLPLPEWLAGKPMRVALGGGIAAFVAVLAIGWALFVCDGRDPSYRVRTITDRVTFPEFALEGGFVAATPARRTVTLDIVRENETPEHFRAVFASSAKLEASVTSGNATVMKARSQPNVDRTAYELDVPPTSFGDSDSIVVAYEVTYTGAFRFPLDLGEIGCPKCEVSYRIPSYPVGRYSIKVEFPNGSEFTHVRLLKRLGGEPQTNAVDLNVTPSRMFTYTERSPRSGAALSFFFVIRRA